MRTESLKFSIESSFSKISVTPGWRFSLTSIMTKQMPVIKNFSNAGSACSAAGLGTDLVRLCLKRNTSLLNSFFNEEGRKKIFVSFLVWYFLVVVFWSGIEHSSILA